MFVRNGQALGSVQVEPKAEPEPQPEPEPEKVEPEPQKSGPPDTHALKQEWIDHAIDRGADPDEAEGLTKAELIELYGGDE